MEPVMDLSYNNFNRLLDDPHDLQESFDCSNNQLTTLCGSPKKVLGNFGCQFNWLLNLEGPPKIIGDNFDCEYNDLTSLYGCPKLVGSEFWCRYNPNLIDVSDIWESEIDKNIWIDMNYNIAILPLSKFNIIFGMKLFEIKKFGSSKQDILNFQCYLIENGYEEHAKWKP